MLTDDKFETALAIARSSGFCLNQTELIHLTLEKRVILWKSIGMLRIKAQKLQEKGSQFVLALAGNVSRFHFQDYSWLFTNLWFYNSSLYFFSSHKLLFFFCQVRYEFTRFSLRNLTSVLQKMIISSYILYFKMNTFCVKI